MSRACHDANIAPWVLMAHKLNLEIRWLDCQSQGVDDSTMDCLDVDGVSKLIDERTRLISIGKALQN